MITWLRDRIPARYREQYYRYAVAVSVLLLAFGSTDRVLLWCQVGMSAFTALFALLYATSSARLALYAITGPLGALLMAYGLVTDARWAIIAAAVGQLFGVTTAAAKTVHPDDVHPYVLFKPGEPAPSDSKV